MSSEKSSSSAPQSSSSPSSTSSSSSSSSSSGTVPFSAWPIGTKIYRILRGTSIIFVLLFSILWLAPLFQIPFIFVFYPFSRRAWRMLNTLFIDWWYALVLFWVEIWNRKKFVLTGDAIPPQERALVISNHPSELDWLVWWPIAYRKGMLGHMKVILKKSIKYVPGLGQGMDDLDFVFLERNWELDELILKHRIQTWIEDKYDLWLFLFPEGTDFSTEKHAKSVEYAKEHGLASYKRLLVPRTTGFVACLQSLGRENLDVVYDFTLAYTDSPLPTPLRNVLNVAPKTVHLHVRRYPLRDIPVDNEDKLKQWLFDRYKEKDDLLEYFNEHKAFPDGVGREVLVSPFLRYLWALWWLVFMGLIVYSMWTSWIYLAVIVFGNIVHIATTVSEPIRRWRALSPPTGYRPVQRTPASPSLGRGNPAQAKSKAVKQD